MYVIVKLPHTSDSLIYILSHVRVTIDWRLRWVMDLLTTCTHLIHMHDSTVADLHT
jgi:hypothetical protein